MEDALVQLAREAKKSDEALLALYKHLLPLIKKWSYKMKSVDYTKEDWEQEAFLMLRYALRHYQEAQGIYFATYFRIILYRKGLKYMKKEKDYLLFEEDEQILLRQDESVHIEEDFVEEERLCERKHLLVDVMKVLDLEEREIIRLFYFEGKTIGEIAMLLEKSYHGVECKKRRILNKLKKRLEKATEKERANYI